MHFSMCFGWIICCNCTQIFDGYLMSNPLHDFYVNSLEVTFLSEPKLICLHMIKWFQVLVFNTNSLI